MRALGIGLIGLGRHGLRYATHLAKGDIADGKLIAVSRRDAVVGKAAAASLHAYYYTDYRDLIHDPKVEVVVVVTPPALALPICLEAVRARKPLLIEKPLAITGAQAHEMVQAAEQAGVPLMTAHTLRFEPVLQEFRAAIPTVGTRRYLTLTSRVEPRPQGPYRADEFGGRGVLLEIGIHLLDAIRVLTGDEVADVQCEMERLESGGPEVRVWASLRTTSGFPVLLDVSRVTRGRVSRAEWVGAEGQLQVDWMHHRLVRTEAGLARQEQAITPAPTVVATLTAFLNAIQHGTPPPISGLDGQRAVEIADACYEAAATGARVFVNRR
jgi:predicted dehydrogenase